MTDTLMRSGFGMLVLAGAAGCAALAPQPPGPRAGPGPVVFVCERGNVKSLIASEWFNRLAAERGLTVRAVSRGLAPETPVPGPIAEQLRSDGFEVRDYRPRALASTDLTKASRLVMIGAAPPSWVSPAKVPVEMWDGIPPASERYAASRDALRERIVALLESLPNPDPAR